MNAGDNICRISSIVGTTSNYLQNNFRDNHKDRITQYIYIPSDVFDEVGIFEFAGRYINTMSLQETTISSWLKGHANPVEYPVHEVKEGANWEFVSIEGNKQLCLYPFTKNSISYLYNYGLTKGHQTPRYIIRDIIEPVVNDVLSNKANFPSLKYNLVNVNTTLSYRIHSQIKDDAQADRLLRFLSIWGDGSPDQYTKDGITYIAAINKEIIEEFGFPTLSLSEVEPPKADPDPGPGPVPSPDPEPDPSRAQKSPIPIKTQEHVSKANAMLTSWSNGQSIDISANVGTSGILRAAQGDMCSYLFSSINWQSEGISMDNISKVKAAKATLVMFEYQTKGTGFYVLPANWESMNVISAFIRWREYGNQSWHYPDSDLDAYLVTAWSSKIKKDIVKAVTAESDSQTSYIEAAITTEMYRMILYGEFRERSLKNLSAQYLFEAKTAKPGKSSHSKEWNSLVSLLSQKGADITNRETVRQYFNLTQGDGGSVVILDEPNLTRVFRKVKTNKLAIPEEDLQPQDTVKLRRDVFVYLKDIVDRIDYVSKAEVANALAVIQSIYDHFDSDVIDEDDILELFDKSKAFYTEVNNTQINIAVASADAVKKAAKQIAKAINDIGEVLEDDDALTILMTFSGDPISDLQPLVELLSKLDTDVENVEKQLLVRKEALGEVAEASQSEAKYFEELKAIGANMTALSGIR